MRDINSKVLFLMCELLICINKMLLLTSTKLEETVSLFRLPHIKIFLPILQIAQKLISQRASWMQMNIYSEQIAQNPPLLWILTIWDILNKCFQSHFSIWLRRCFSSTCGVESVCDAYLKHFRHGSDLFLHVYTLWILKALKRYWDVNKLKG